MRWMLGLAVLIGMAWTTDTDTVRIEVQLSGCDQQDSLYVYEFTGLNFRQVLAVAISESAAVVELPASDPRFYYIGIDPGNVRPIIVGTESSISLTTNCRVFRQASITGSELNEQYENVKTRMGEIKTRSNTLSQQYRQFGDQPEAQQRVVAQMEMLDATKLDFLDSLRTHKPYLAHVMALNTYLFYPLHGEEYPNEIPYFAGEFFRFVDWNDPGLDYMPWVYESWKAYTETLCRIGIGAEQTVAYIQASLGEIPKERRSRQLAFGGALASLQQNQHPGYVPVAEMFMEEYGERFPDLAETIEAQLQLVRATSIGGEAPDFSQETPEGEMLSLSDLRGQVVLVDFWASWCGPCRRENPNVVKAYEKFHEQGFEVLGVSLDRDRDRWLQAIEADGLIWKHVSDLKGWSNEVAQMYGVRSIPHTILLDKEGRIIARNLRGAALEARLTEIFGE